jgi:hypothetical protein
MAVVPAKRARPGHPADKGGGDPVNRARASRDPVIHGRSECTNRFDYWIPALVRRAKPGSLGRNDRQGCCGTTRSPLVGAKCDSPT